MSALRLDRRRVASVLPPAAASARGTDCAVASNAISGEQRRARDCLAELVEIATLESAAPNATRVAAEAVTRHLRAGGFAALRAIAAQSNVSLTMVYAPVPSPPSTVDTDAIDRLNAGFP